MMVHFSPLAVLGIYSKEDGRGMLFPDEADAENSPDDEPNPPKPSRERPSLKVVK